MTIEVQDEALRGLELTEPQALMDLAVGLFTERRVTLGRAAAVARVTHLDFQRVQTPAFLEVKQAANRAMVTRLEAELDLGEAEAIVLAKEINAAPVDR